MRCAVSVASLVVLGLGACGPVPGAPPSRAPINACAPSDPNACAAYRPSQAGVVGAKCGAEGICLVAAQISYTLVVSLPETSFFAPNKTFAIPYAKLFEHSDSIACPRIPKKNDIQCAQLPPIATASGLYQIDAAVSNSEVHFFLGNTTPTTVLPARVTYRPMWPPDSTTPGDAMALGLPLLPARADAIVAPFGIPGPGGAPTSVSFRVQLAPGTYERTIMPEPPFDSAFPPDVGVLVVPETPTGFEQDELTAVDRTKSPTGNPTIPRFDLFREDGELLDGATVFLRDVKTQRRVSALVTLGANNHDSGPPITYHVVLGTNHHPSDPDHPELAPDALFGTELVLSPNVDARPTLVIGRVGGTIPPSEKYPMIPEAALVSGTVISEFDSLPLAAEVVVTSTKIFTPNDPAGYTLNLVHTARFRSGGDGQFSVRLPRGEYDVVVSPDAPGFAKTMPPTLTVDATHPTQAGIGFQVGRKRTVIGSVLVADGRALASADVEALAAAAGQATPNAPVPRSAQARTDDAGNFTMQLDPGTYDIRVRPALGTRLPWIVSPSRLVQATDVVLPPLEVPAPIDARMRLLDPQHNAIVRALVRAYAQPAKGAPFVEIGRALTDARGQFEMWLAPH